MYRKSSKGWLKHFDFILIDLISLHLAFVLSYVCRHGIGNPYKNLLYRNMAFMLTFIDFFVVFLFETLKGVLRRGYYQELAATVKHVILVMLLAVLYLFTIQEGTSFSRSVLYFTAVFYIIFAYVTRILWKKHFILSTANTLQLSKASVTSYLPYQKGVYFPSTADKGKISVGAERRRRYRAVRKLRSEPTEEHLWETVLLYSGVRFKTYSGLPFTYEIRKGRSGEYTKELWIDRRENSKSLAWSSVLLALRNMKKVGEEVDRPKALGDIRGVTYIYGMFYRFGLIDVPDDVKEKMDHPKNRKK